MLPLPGRGSHLPRSIARLILILQMQAGLRVTQVRSQPWALLPLESMVGGGARKRGTRRALQSHGAMRTQSCLQRAQLYCIRLSQDAERSHQVI